MAFEQHDLTKALQRAVQPTDSSSFQEDFGVDPVEALAAKGIKLSDAERERLITQVADLRANRPAAAAGEVEVTVSVGVKF
jgi:hypothetical protein